MDVAMKDQAPNLLELFEARSARAADIWGAELAACDEKTARDMSEEAALAKAASASNSVLAFLSVCADEFDSGPSDARLKTDIEQVGTTVYGLPLYHFRYRQGGGRFEGVMAQDVLEVMPSAVMTGADGFHSVRYSDLGITMRRL